MLKLHGSFLKWSQCCFKVSFLNVVLVVVFYWLQICSLMRSCYFQNALHTWKPPAYLVWSIQALSMLDVLLMKLLICLQWKTFGLINIAMGYDFASYMCAWHSEFWFWMFCWWSSLFACSGKPLAWEILPLVMISAAHVFMAQWIWCYSTFSSLIACLHKKKFVK